MDVDVTIFCPVSGQIPGTLEDATFKKLRVLACCETAETIRMPHGNLMVVDEDGMNLGKPYNTQATNVLRRAGYNDRHSIHGTAVIISEQDFKKLPYGE